MENKLKVGQQFEVVEVLTEGMFTDETLLKIGGWTVGLDSPGRPVVRCFPNGSNYYNYPNLLNMFIDIEVKPVGRLTVTKIK